MGIIDVIIDADGFWNEDARHHCIRELSIYNLSTHRSETHYFWPCRLYSSLRASEQTTVRWAQSFLHGLPYDPLPPETPIGNCHGIKPYVKQILTNAKVQTGKQNLVVGYKAGEMLKHILLSVDGIEMCDLNKMGCPPLRELLLRQMESSIENRHMFERVCDYSIHDLNKKFHLLRHCSKQKVFVYAWWVMEGRFR